jgi:uncharacterized glyoxalase superfamily protein PhnB
MLKNRSVPAHETVYGERQYGAEDLEGHHWLFSRHARDAKMSVSAEHSP